jgi:hypothetical protein
VALAGAAALCALTLGATVEVPAGAPLAPALAALRPGDVLRLGPGEHRGALGRLEDVTVEGAGPERTRVIAPEGQDGAVTRGTVALRGLTLEAGDQRAALKVLAGATTLEHAVLAGGSSGAFVGGGRLVARDVDLAGDHGLLAQQADVLLDGGSARGAGAGLALVSGRLEVRRFAVVGPSREAGITVSRGTARLEGVAIRGAGPSGVVVGRGGRVEAAGLLVAGARHDGPGLGDCLMSLGGEATLEGALLVRCAGAAVEASGGSLRLSGVDAGAGEAGCLALVNGARADLDAVHCAGPGPGLVAASGASAKVRRSTFRTDPIFWVECAAGSRVDLAPGDPLRQPCAEPAPAAP